MKKSVWEQYRDAVINREIKTLDELAKLYDQARQLHQQGQWQAVVDLMTMIRNVKSDYPDPEKLLSSAQKALADQEKATFLEATYNQAQEAIFSGRWQEARRLLKQIQRLETDFRDVPKLLEYVETTQEAKRLAAQQKKASAGAAERPGQLPRTRRPRLEGESKAEARMIQIVAGLLIGVSILIGLVWLFLLTLPKQTPAVTMTSQAARLADTQMPATIMPLSSPTDLPFSTVTPSPTTSPTITPTPTLGIGSTIVSPMDGMRLVYIPAGDFLMGSANQKVYLDAFWIDQIEVTNGMFAQCVAAGACQAPISRDYDVTLFADYPVIWVNWSQAQAYCQWAGRRLPTEAEWEKAARGTDGRIYPWGNDPINGERLNFCDINCPYEWRDVNVNDGFAGLAPVGSFPAGSSPYGVLDMAGNALEWVADWYQRFISIPVGARNPQGPVSGETRVLRGGSFNNFERFVRTIMRNGNDPTLTYGNVGFRCAMSATPSD